MLPRALSVRLLLWAGRTVPRPVPSEVLQALTDVTVTSDAEDDDGFQITFAVGKRKSGEFDLVQDGALALESRVILAVIMGASPEPLIDGVISHHQLRPGSEPGASTLVVTGRDLRVLLNLRETDVPFPNQSSDGIVRQILTNPAYAQYGFVPDVRPASNAPSELERVPGQHSTDLEYIRRLAEQHGYVFYLEPLTLGTNRVYWGPRQRGGPPQPTLSFNLGTLSNVQEIFFTQGTDGPVNAEGLFMEPTNRQSVAIPTLPGLRDPPLARQPTSARRTERLRTVAQRSPDEAADDLRARVTNALEGADCTGRADGVRYGRVLRARQLVGVRGAGRDSDGLYYVKSVTHRLARGSYTQEFRLQREGTGALAPFLPP